MELGSLPLWAQQLGGLIMTIATAVALTWNERRKRKEPETARAGAETQVVAASFMDSRSLRELTDVMSDVRRELQESREQRHQDSLHERDAFDRNTQALHENTLTRRAGGLPPEMLALLGRVGPVG